MQEKIKQALSKDFETNRIIFWYDAKSEFLDIFQTLQLENVEKIELQNNEFSVKYRVLHKQPGQKFLIYQSSARPQNEENWLLDVLVSYKEFHANKQALWLAELGLDYYDYKDLISQHDKFFALSDLRQRLQERITDSSIKWDQMRLKMLAAYFKLPSNQDSLHDIVFCLFESYVTNKWEKIEKDLSDYNLVSFLFEQISLHYRYQSDTPTLKDFLTQLFLFNFEQAIQGNLTHKLNNDASYLFQQWKNSRRFENSFQVISDEMAGILQISSRLLSYSAEQLLNIDYFREIDEYIAKELISKLSINNGTLNDVLNIIKSRKHTFWWESQNEIKTLYCILENAANFLINSNLVQSYVPSDASKMIEDYTTRWYLMDLYYRKYFTYMRSSNRVTQFKQITNEIDKRYENFLLVLNNNWQHILDENSMWNFDEVLPQRHFFRNFIQSSRQRMVVIISDALRYEIATEVVQRLKEESGYVVKMGHMISSLPSITSIGMAALLPNSSLQLDERGDALVDDLSSTGIDNRDKLLAASKLRAAVAKAEHLIDLDQEDIRNLIKEKDVVYIYHNRIDAMGHSHETEKRVFDEAELCVEELIKLIKKLARNSVRNILLTADHGFLYQNNVLEDGCFIDDIPEAENILFKDRRCVFGYGIAEHKNFKRYTASQLGFAGNLEFAFPKSISRLRQKGAVSQYVHGGVSLQEVIIPVLEINKKRGVEIERVGVRLLVGAKIISTSQLVINLYQEQKVEKQIHPRTIRIGVYNRKNELISNEQEIVFDSTSDDVREREKRIVLIFSNKLDNSNGQKVFLRLEEREPGTSHYKQYDEFSYIVRKTFETDF